MSDIGRLEQVDLRSLWRHEEYGFSAWLENNLEQLGEALGRRFSDPQREVAAGGYFVDMLVEDEEGDRVVIENQLAPTDHDHLGKLLTYLTNLDAKTAVWIVKDARPEHMRAVQWLNETTPDDIAFFIVKLAAFRIGDSSPAPLFTPIVGPSASSKDIGRSKKVLAERHVLRLRFWEQLLGLARSRGLMLHAQRTPTKEHWLGAGAGIRSGLAFNYLAWMEGEAGVELYIDTGNAEENKRIFDLFYSKRQEIESEFGAPLLWDRLDQKRASRIKHVFTCAGLVREDQWEVIQAQLVDNMDRFSRSIRNCGVRL